MFKSTHRRGVTLLELVLFIALLGMVIVFLIPFLVFSQENQRRQQALANVQETGASILQGIGRRLRDAERIQYPPLQAEGDVLALQTITGTTDPTLIALSGTTLYVIEQSRMQAITSPDITVRNFRVTNTSASATRQSLHVRFELDQEIPLVQTGSFMRAFETVYTLFPADVTTGNACGCAVFTCSAVNTFQWGVCDPTCSAQQRSLTCTP